MTCLVIRIGEHFEHIFPGWLLHLACSFWGVSQTGMGLQPLQLLAQVDELITFAHALPARLSNPIVLPFFASPISLPGLGRNAICGRCLCPRCSNGLCTCRKWSLRTLSNHCFPLLCKRSSKLVFCFVGPPLQMHGPAFPFDSCAIAHCASSALYSGRVHFLAWGS